MNCGAHMVAPLESCLHSRTHKWKPRRSPRRILPLSGGEEVGQLSFPRVHSQIHSFKAVFLHSSCRMPSASHCVVLVLTIKAKGTWKAIYCKMSSDLLCSTNLFAWDIKNSAVCPCCCSRASAKLISTMTVWFTFPSVKARKGSSSFHTLGDLSEFSGWISTQVSFSLKQAVRAWPTAYVAEFVKVFLCSLQRLLKLWHLPNHRANLSHAYRTHCFPSILMPFVRSIPSWARWNHFF